MSSFDAVLAVYVAVWGTPPRGTGAYLGTYTYSPAIVRRASQSNEDELETLNLRVVSGIPRY